MKYNRGLAKMNKLYQLTIAFFMIFLISTISLPIAKANSMSSNSDGTVELDQAWGAYDITLPDPDDACTQQSEDIQDFIDFMESDLMQTLTDITSILYGISTIISIVHGITSTLASVFPGNLQDCRLPAWGRVACGIAQIAYYITGKIQTIWGPITTFVMCQSKDPAWPPYGWCSRESFVNLGGTDKYNLDPFENIYTAVSCLCPTAILFNLRKLKLIYQTYDCCITSMCDQGYSVEGCYQYLDEATCMYWEGSIIEMLWTLIVQLVAYYIVAQVLDYVLTEILRLSETTAEGLLEMVKMGFAIDGLKDAFETLQDRFEEPDCSELLDEIGIDDSSSDVDTTNILTDDEGVYNLVD
jgi:hypothetical protein